MKDNPLYISNMTLENLLIHVFILQLQVIFRLLSQRTIYLSSNTDQQISKIISVIIIWLLYAKQIRVRKNLVIINSVGVSLYCCIF
jgi:hypothetical protein